MPLSQEGSTMQEVRRQFHAELDAVEEAVQQSAAKAQALLAKALRALVDDDVASCEEVIKGDDEIDKLYLDIERRILNLFALQTPVASDLRLLAVMLHVNLHLERIGDK